MIKNELLDKWRKIYMNSGGDANVIRILLDEVVLLSKLVKHNKDADKELVKARAEHGEEITKLKKERDKWKWEYENLCKFANDFEDRAAKAEAKVEVARREGGEKALSKMALHLESHASSGEVDYQMARGLLQAATEIRYEIEVGSKEHEKAN